ncbi:PAS domain S-box protein [Mucilaginibacter sp. BT774]|uniref:sensor histidine kinase n=1 Tax=Mucilaginibacter sp. BT774 TaxID=3062276 RepID=UPI002675B689|nr:PAS domain S-box protein [Mucilaginibacter sp. BT774]MDO3627635.1 PAS domain S-box protein [Mucilaginibacter sp. BT774]
MPRKLNRLLQFGYGFSVLMLATVGLLAYLTFHNLLVSNRAVTHSNLVIAKLEKVLPIMKDAETGQRGFLLTGRPEFLESYRGSYSQAMAVTGELESLTSDNARQQQNIRDIRDVLEHRLAILKVLIDKKQRGQILIPADFHAGKSAMDELRRDVDQAERYEQHLLQEGTLVLGRYTQWTPVTILTAIILAVIISVYSYLKVISDVGEKDRLRAEVVGNAEETTALNEELTAANEEITAANEELTAINEEVLETREQLASANAILEQRVTERTKALQESEEETQALNEELTASNEELAAANEELVSINEELRQAEERSAKLAAIVETSDDAIIGKTLEGIVTSWNQGAERMFGYPESEIVGQSILKLIPENRQQEEPAIIAQIEAGQRVDHYETQRLTRDGRLIDVSLTISPILDKQGHITGVSKIARDISEQKSDEQRKNDFIGMASHELKTPLTSLTALIQVLEQKLRSSDDPFIPQALEKSRLQTRKMAALINGFLNISRLESGKLVIEKQNFELNALISEMIDEARLTVASHIFVFERNEAIMVNADREKLGSVISNLLSNAVKYSPRGEMVTIRSSIENGRAWFSVQDQGMGIHSADLPKIFDRYYRASSTHTRHIAGFGVGLYLSAEIIKHHGGRIWAESEKAVGSTFFVSLPIKE